MRLTVDKLSKSISIVGACSSLADHLGDLTAGVSIPRRWDSVVKTYHSSRARGLNLTSEVAVASAITVVTLHQAWVADAIVGGWNLLHC